MDLYNLVVSAKLSKGGGDEPVLIDKTISANGTYNASSDNADGYKKVVANVPEPSGTVNITQNGTVDVSQYASANVNVSGGGGATNFVQGTFITESTSGAYTLTIPYTGNGYPIAAIVVVDGGMYNSNNSDWYSVVKQYAVGEWVLTKSAFTESPQYDSDVSQNYGTVAIIYKSSASSGTTYSRSGGSTIASYSSSDATGTTSLCCRFKSNTTLSYYVMDSSYGLMPSLKYRYFIVYSE